MVGLEQEVGHTVGSSRVKMGGSQWEACMPGLITLSCPRPAPFFSLGLMPVKKLERRTKRCQRRTVGENVAYWAVRM